MSTPIDTKKLAVLYVDDEEQALKYFRRGLERDFRVLTAPDVTAALAILEKEAADIAVVITDYRMPGRTGVSLLGEVRERWPQCMRILTTAYSDLENAIEAVNSGAIYKYLAKPVDFNLLKETLRGAIEVYLQSSKRETLLEIKMSELRRTIVGDRVQTFGNLTRGIAHHLRNSIQAVTCLFEELAEGPGDSQADPIYARQLWTLASSEHQRLVKMLETVQQVSVLPEFKINGGTNALTLLNAAVQQGGLAADRVTVTIDPAVTELHVDAARLTETLATLSRQVDRLCTPAAALSITLTAAPGPVPAVRFNISGAGPAWTDEDVSTFFTPFAFPKHDPSEIGLGLLSAFYTVSAHGGDLIVHRGVPHGPGFELTLPAVPTAAAPGSLNSNLLTTLFADEVATPQPVPFRQSA